MKNPLIYGLWFGRSKPNLQAFLQAFVEDMNKLSTNGLSMESNGKNYNIKFHPLCCCVDFVARAPMQIILQYNEKYACNWCLHPGEHDGSTIRYPTISPMPNRRTIVQTKSHVEIWEEAGKTTCEF